MLEETAFNSRPTSHWQRNYLDNFPERKTSSEMKWKSLSHVRLFVTPRTIQALEFFRPEYWSGYLVLVVGKIPVDLPNPGTEPRSPTLQADSLPAEPQGKPKNTGVGSLFLLQRIFPSQESDQGLLHCRYILYQLSYQGSPDIQPLSK